MVQRWGSDNAWAWKASATTVESFYEVLRIFVGTWRFFRWICVVLQARERVLTVHIELFLVLHLNRSIAVIMKTRLVEFNSFPEQWFNEAVETFVACISLVRSWRRRSVIFLDWSGVDLSSNPLHPASKLFDSRSSLELQYIYILKIEWHGIGIVL